MRNEARLPGATRCPECGEALDAATGTFGADKPGPGDITVCIYCGHLMAFTRTLKMRELTKAERRSVADDPRITMTETARAAVMRKHNH